MVKVTAHSPVFSGVPLTLRLRAADSQRQGALDPEG